ncbi:class I SAM-dependent methyltransferase, partial [Candidatus Beckwithbacteria bacterium]|nr:class I SAM-dependent methyltransferase [Candidatus Beckwithbacteria bacterium]
KYFDLVVSREVLEHIPHNEIDSCIDEWDRVSQGKMVHIIAVSERGPSAIDDPVHINVQSENWWINKFKQHDYQAIKNPQKFFISPFGNSGYLMFLKN